MALPTAARNRANSILGYFVRHKTIANLLMVISVVAGLLAASQLRTQFFPDIVFDSVNVNVRWTGAGPEDVDGAIISVLEPVVLAVEGVESSHSVASEGSARIRLEFEPDWDMARAANDVKEAVESVTNLPENADEPTVRRGAWRDRVTDVVISGPVGRDQLGRFADELVARLFREGITRTSIRGVPNPEVRVSVPEANLIRHDVSLSEVADAIGAEAEADPAGDVADGTARLRTGVAKRAVEDIETIEVRSNADGSTLLVSDVGEVEVLGSDQGVEFFKGTYPAVSIRVDRSDLGDAIEMQAAVQRIADEMELSLPQGVQIELIRTRAEAITQRINLLFSNGALGLVLVLGLLFLFLNFRTAFWVAAGIPVALMAALALMYLAGLTINMISLFGLIICLGIVVDDAIVVGEHADFRARTLGEPPQVAAENAAARMASPVFSATLTTVIAFAGLTMIEGRFGSLIADIPFTVCVVLIASLFECFLILPHHMAGALAGSRKDAWYDRPSLFFNKWFGKFREQIFRPLINGVIAFRYPVVAGAIVILSLVITMWMSGTVTWRFFSPPERGSISGNIAMLPGATRDDTFEMIQELQRAVDQVSTEYEAEHGVDPISFTMLQLGGTTGRGLSGQSTKEPSQLGSISIELIDRDQRPTSSFAILGAVQDAVRNHPMLETLSFRGWRSGPGGDSLDVMFFGADAQTLKAASEKLKTELDQFGEVSAVEDDLAFDKDELVLELTPQGRALGFNIDALGRDLYQRLNGIQAAEFPVGARTGKITVAVDEDELTADYLNRTRVRSPNGAFVVLSDIVTVTQAAGFSQVIRENGLRRINVTGEISDDDPERARTITETLRDQILPGITSEFGVDFRLGGLAEQEGDFLNDSLMALYICLLGIFLVLSWIFSSWARPIVVMVIIPFGLVGTIWGHYIWDVPLSMFTVVGLIGMTGIIINDSIVLISTIDEYAEKKGIRQAVVDATADRLRPVVLTTLTTVLGLAPLLYETSAQAQFLKPTVITLAYGLGFGLFIVLLIVPSVIIIQQDVGRMFRALRRSSTGRAVPSRARAIVLGSIAGTLGVLSVTIGAWLMNGQAPGLIARFAQNGFGIGSGLGATAFCAFVGLVLVFLISLFVAARPVQQGVQKELR